MPSLPTSSTDALREPVLAILRKSDLASISAKRVRLSLSELQDPQNPSERLLARLQVDLSDKEQKKDVDELIRSCFDDVRSKDASAPSSANNTPKLALPGIGGVPGSNTSSDAWGQSSPSQKAAPKRSRGQEDVISDEEVDADPAKIKKKAVSAEQSKQTKQPKKKRKSAKTENGEKAPPNPNNPFNRPVVLSEEMSKVCGAKEMPRYMITKQLWAYIKEKDLQNPSNKRQIVCDETLTSLFGKGTVDSFEMAKLISKHVSKKET